MYSGRGQFVGTDRAFPEQLRLWSAEVEDGAGLGDRGGAGVDEEGDAAGELVEDGGGCRAWGDAAAVGAGGGEGADAAGEGAQEGVVGQTHADGAAGRGEGWRQVVARGEHEGEGAGPVTVDKGLGRGLAGGAHDARQLANVTQQDGQRFLAWALLYGEEAVDGRSALAEADEAVDGVGGHADDGAPLHGGGGFLQRAGLAGRDHGCLRFRSAPVGLFHARLLRSGCVCASAKGSAVISALLCAVYT